MSEINDNIANDAGRAREEDGFSPSAERSATPQAPMGLPRGNQGVRAEGASFSTDHRQIPAVERIARVLAGRRLSINGLGTSASAGKQVDQIWQSFVDDAVGILNALREPDPAMLEAGDGAIWTAMVRAALGEPFDRVARSPLQAPAEIYQKPLG